MEIWGSLVSNLTVQIVDDTIDCHSRTTTKARELVFHSTISPAGRPLYIMVVVTARTQQ